MDIKTTSDAFTLALQLAVTGTDEAKVKECNRYKCNRYSHLLSPFQKIC